MPTSRHSKTSSTQRGYGYKHQQARKRALAAHTDGAPCHLCHRPMYRTQELHLDHDPIAKRAGRIVYRGLTHAHCNRGDGGTRSHAHQHLPQPSTTRCNPSAPW